VPPSPCIRRGSVYIYAAPTPLAGVPAVWFVSWPCILLFYADLIRIVFFFLEVTENYAIFAARILKVITIMARPIRETPVLKGEDAFNFEWRRLMVENRTPEEKAEARRKFEEEVAEAKKHLNIKWCW
jgi:hypothetical protein